MAIDTEQKRSSMMNLSSLDNMGAPDGNMNMPDRAIFNWEYSAYDYTPPTPPASTQAYFKVNGLPTFPIREFVYRVVQILNGRTWPQTLQTNSG